MEDFTTLSRVVAGVRTLNNDMTELCTLRKTDISCDQQNLKLRFPVTPMISIGAVVTWQRNNRDKQARPDSSCVVKSLKAGADPRMLCVAERGYGNQLL